MIVVFYGWYTDQQALLALRLQPHKDTVAQEATRGPRGFKATLSKVRRGLNVLKVH